MSAAELKRRGDTHSQTELKRQLVDCIRMLERSDIIDYNGHCSSRVDDRILINIGSCQRSRLTVDDICVIDLVFFQAEDGIRDWSVTGVQTCALPICQLPVSAAGGAKITTIEGLASGK